MQNRLTVLKNTFFVTLLLHACCISASDTSKPEQMESFDQRISLFADKMEAFPIDFLLMPSYEGRHKARIEHHPELKNNPRIFENSPRYSGYCAPWCYRLLRYEITYERLSLWWSFIHSAYKASADELESCKQAIDNVTPKKRALMLTVLFLSADEKFLDVFEKCKNDQSIAFPSITITEEDKSNFAKEAFEWTYANKDRVFWIPNVPQGRFENVCFWLYQFTSSGGARYDKTRGDDPEIVFELAENSSEQPKTVADFANAFLWYWYHFEEDKQLKQPLFFSKFMEDDRTIPVFPDEKYEELKKRLETETFYYTKTSIRQNAMYNSPQRYRNEMRGEIREYVKSLPEDAHFLLEIKANYKLRDPKTNELIDVMLL